MSAALALPFVIPMALAVAEPAQPAPQPSLVDGRSESRQGALMVLHRYLQTSMLVGRSPCLLGNYVFRGRVSSHRIPSFEDAIIFLFDVEKCLKQLDAFSRVVIAHIALEDYSPVEAALLTGESKRTIHRVYGAALERLAELFREYEVFGQSVENLSRGGRA
ncbi:MAG TPA: hypothetical protein VHX13_06880 [Acidobacteriaceae bacterium]|jgi:hypothetical protein|nr:hypothetical protein [Acidobacteriaceae bacterium]